MRLAHLTDAHLLEPHAERSRADHVTMRLTSFGRSLDAGARLERLTRALDAAKRSGADHVVLTGDLTEMGTVAQYEALAAALLASGLSPEAVTLVPGNHDSYAGPRAWSRAMEGPLAPFARSSAPARGFTLVEREAFAIVAVDTSVHQSFALSGGALRADVCAAIGRLAADRALRDRPLVVALHHPPFTYQVPLVRWIDSLRGGARLVALIAREAHLHALHGHLHRPSDRAFGEGGPRVFCARAVVMEGDPLRLYEARGVRLVPCEAPSRVSAPVAPPSTRAPDPAARPPSPRTRRW